MKTKEIFACAAFGLEDQVVQIEGDLFCNSFYLSDALLPETPFGKILTGEAAEEERIHSGLYWPMEARIKRGEPLRRAPIPCVWRGLVEAEDKMARWHVGRGVNFNFSRILAVHVLNLLQKAGCNPQDKTILAIPDTLDEFGQDALIRDFKALGYGNIHFLWRPVAAALSWLSEIDQNNQFDISENAREHIIVICVSPDNIEMTTFQLKKIEVDNTFFVIPVRQRPKYFSNITGFDWAANCLELTYPSIDDGGFWQAYTNIPHVWQAICGKPFSEDTIEWCVNDHWTLWQTDSELINNIKRASSAPNKRLRELLTSSCRLFADTRVEDISVEQRLEKLFLNILSSNSESTLRGVIVAGSLCPSKLPQWIQSAKAELENMGIKSFSFKPKPDVIWLAHNQNAILDGCAEYGRRLEFNLPTYLDTLPKLSLLIEKRGEHVWADLLNSETCEGGKEYKPAPIRGQFAIREGTRNLQVYLKKGKNKRKESDQNPYRNAEFPFPSIPEKTIPVDISVKIRPASGLAQISLIPSQDEDLSFLRGRQIFLDYSTMIDTDPPPPPSLGWPNLLKIDIDSNSSFVYDYRWKIKRYLEISTQDISFYNAVETIYDDIFKQGVFDGNQNAFVKSIDHNGMAATKEANQIIDKIAQKASNDFQHIPIKDRRKFLTRMSWLFAKTPENLKKGIQNILSGYAYGADWNWMVEAAGRSFTTQSEFEFLFSRIKRKIDSVDGNTFPINCPKALWRLLSLRAQSPDAMSESQAREFTNQAITMMEQERNIGHFLKKFFVAARLFLYLLRYRIVNPDFLDPENHCDQDLFDRALDCLHSAENYFLENSNHNADKARELVKGIEDFMYYKGNNEILVALNDFAGD